MKNLTMKIILIIFNLLLFPFCHTYASNAPGASLFGGISYVTGEDANLLSMGYDFGGYFHLPSKTNKIFGIMLKTNSWIPDEDKFISAIEDEVGYIPNDLYIDINLKVNVIQAIPFIRIMPKDTLKDLTAFFDIGLSLMHIEYNGDVSIIYNGSTETLPFDEYDDYVKLYLGLGFLKHLGKSNYLLLYPSYNFGGHLDFNIGLHFFAPKRG
jgi:hypothetical protein